MRIPERGYEGATEAGAAGLREGFARLARAAESLSSAGIADAAATVSISEDARRLGGRVPSEVDVLDAMLELRRASLTVSTSVAVLQSADDMARDALALGRR
jgi:hypothetical protein